MGTVEQRCRSSAKSPAPLSILGDYPPTTQNSAWPMAVCIKKQRTDSSVLWLSSRLELAASQSLGLIALPAVHRPILARLKRHLGGLAAAGANGIVHYPRGSPRSSALGLFPCLSAFAAARRLIGKTFLRIKLLLTGGKHKLLAAIPTC